MKTIQKSVQSSLFLIYFLIVGTNLFAQQESTSDKKAHLSVEIDPATFAFSGYSAHLRFQPKNAKHLLVGAGIYAMDFPSIFVDLNEKNKDKDWDVRLDLGYGLFGEYHFAEVNRKWFAGTQVSFQEFKIENENLIGNTSFTNLLIMAYGGYTLQPFELPLYFKFWGGVGYTSKISGSNQLKGATYDIAPITPFATVHIGYTL